MHDCSAGVVPDVKTTWHVAAAVAVWRTTVSIAVWIPWRLLLAMVIVSAVRLVDCIALAAEPRPFLLEFNVPVAVRRILQSLSYRRVPRVCPHTSTVDPDGLTEAGAGAEFHLATEENVSLGFE